MPALTPPMGWNTWNRFLDENHRADFDATTETAVLEQARALVDTGLAAAGYNYVVMDDCYQSFRRDYRGRLVGHPHRFKSGIKCLADEIHALGLKFGIYAVPGSQTCAQQYFDYHGLDLGSLNYEQVDAEAFSEWGVDYVKYDWCRAHINDGLKAPEAFKKMADELKRVNPDIVYSISEYGLFQSHLWAPEFANLWRTTDDLLPHWDSVMRTLDQQVDLFPYSRPGHWNDPDMLQVGNGTLTPAENRTHFFLWAILNAPLMAGNDLTKMSDETLNLLKHPGVIAIDQDWGGSQGRLVHNQEGMQMWEKPMSSGGVASVLVNRNEVTTSFNLVERYRQGSTYVDVWSGDQINDTVISLAPHDSIIFTSR